MSVYTVLEGVAQYPTDKLFERAKRILDKGGYIDREYSCLITDGEPSGVLFDRTIVFPGCPYRNLETEPVLAGSTNWVLWTLTDGGFEAGFIVNGAELEGVDLEEFAKTLSLSINTEFPADVKLLADECRDGIIKIYKTTGLPSDAPFPTRKEVYDFDEQQGQGLLYDWEDVVIGYFKCVMYAKYYDMIRPTLDTFYKGYELWRKILRDTRKRVQPS